MITWVFLHKDTGEEVGITMTMDRALWFIKSGVNPMTAPIEGLRFSLKACLEVNPDLEGFDPKEIRSISIIRLKEKIKSFKNIKDVEQYLVDDLKKYGYICIQRQRKGFRAEVIKCQGQTS